MRWVDRWRRLPTGHSHGPGWAGRWISTAPPERYPCPPNSTCLSLREARHPATGEAAPARYMIIRDVPPKRPERPKPPAKKAGKVHRRKRKDPQLKLF